MSGATKSGWDATLEGMIETITGRIEVLRMRADKPICAPKTTVRNANGDIRIDGTAMTFAIPLTTL